ncbi:pectate lyase [Microbulbifer elongatus]|uniref:pectate lyase n=1 Tax=Microbulbifer elongatus TaxID=86173 RepID=UPI001E4A12B2|nr:pectate lyase [Microbulbifer elongatus]
MTLRPVPPARWIGAARLFSLSLVLLFSGGCSPEAENADAYQPARNMEDYRALSRFFSELDQKALAAERKAAGIKKSTKPTKAKLFGFDVKKARHDRDYIASDEGRALADSLLSYQTPSGGWSKRTDMRIPREPGQYYGTEKKYIPTFDNNATSVQFWVMVNACNTTGEARYCDSASRALRYILLAQYPNGGWPQTFPLRGGYHDDITFNDDAIANLLEIIGVVAQGGARFAFLPEHLKAWARDSLRRALDMLVATQVKVNGEPTIWGAQHHPLTLEPTSARAFEPVALATSESADLMLFLMTIENPSPPVRDAIDSAAGWFEKHRIDGLRYRRGEVLPALMPDENADPLWGRFYDIDSSRPVFGDRDGSIQFEIKKISAERREGYAWYSERPYKALKEYRKWKQ